MKRFKTIFIIFTLLISNKSFANDSIQFRVYVLNQFVEQKITFYMYRVKNKKDLIYKTKTQKRRIDYFDYSLPSKAQNRPFDFWIYVKNKLFFGGRWVRISTVYEKDKYLVVYFSDEKKRKYCYDTYWIDKNIQMKFR